MENLVLYKFLINGLHENKYLFRDVNGKLHFIIDDNNENDYKCDALDFISLALFENLTPNEIVRRGETSFSISEDVLSTKFFVNRFKLYEVDDDLKFKYVYTIFQPLLLKLLADNFKVTTWFTSNTSTNDNDPEYLYVYNPTTQEIHYYNDVYDKDKSYPAIVDDTYGYVLLTNRVEISDLLHEFANGVYDVVSETPINDDSKENVKDDVKENIEFINKKDVFNVDLEKEYTNQICEIFEDWENVNAKRKELGLIEFPRLDSLVKLELFLNRRVDHKFPKEFMLWVEQFIIVNSYFISVLNDWRSVSDFKIKGEV